MGILDRRPDPDPPRCCLCGGPAALPSSRYGWLCKQDRLAVFGPESDEHTSARAKRRAIFDRFPGIAARFPSWS